MLGCAAENFSAKRFAEYLSLASGSIAWSDSERQRDKFWVASTDEVFGVLSEKQRRLRLSSLRDPEP